MLTNISSWPITLQINQDSDNIKFVAEKPLRHLPGKRLTCSGYWQDKPVVAKLYLDPRNCQRHWLREKKGIEALQKANITTPALLFSGYLTDQTPVLLFEQIPAAETALDIWQKFTTDKQRSLFLQQLLAELATHHLAGIMQTDLHLNNFLSSNDTWYTIDADTIDSSGIGKPLPLNDSITNLALFFAQIPPQYDYLIEPSLSEYVQRRKLEISTICEPLTHLLKEARKQRRHKFIKKSYRTCSEFIRRNSKNQIAIYRRDADPQRIKELLADPDALIVTGKILKDGNSATVARIDHPHSNWVIKRYNVKNFWHGLKRCLRPSRAWISWGNAHRLTITGISTPKAIAVIEKRFGLLRWGAYYVCEHIPGCDAADYFHNMTQAQNSDETTAQNFISLFDILHRTGIHHGDCKATNFLINKKQVWVIDLDAMLEFKSRQKYLRHYRIDRKRFLQNWQPESKLWCWFDDHLPL